VTVKICSAVCKSVQYGTYLSDHVVLLSKNVTIHITCESGS